MAIYTPPDYMNLYTEQVEINAKLKRAIANCIDDLRDQFATAALTGICAEGGTGKYEDDVKTAYKYADAMLKEKNKGLSI